jgi:hypothetical protein
MRPSANINLTKHDVEFAEVVAMFVGHFVEERDPRPAGRRVCARDRHGERRLGAGFLLAVALFDGMALPMYWLCLARANDYLRPEEMVPASRSLILMASFGAALGPRAPRPPWRCSARRRSSGGWPRSTARSAPSRSGA